MKNDTCVCDKLYEPCDSKYRVEERLLAELTGLPYPAYVECVRELLTAIGYTNVTIERKHLRGRNSGGGSDLGCTSPSGVTPALVVAQVKQYAVPVQKRYVDEIRGAMLRLGARHGVIVTTSTFSPVARQAAFACASVAPIRLLAGRELAGLLVRHGIGVTTAIRKIQTVDAGYFDCLRERHGNEASR